MSKYAKFWALMKELPYADKEVIVEKFTSGRTVHLHEVTDDEYRRMTDAMEGIVSEQRRSAFIEKRRKQRSICLRLMQDLGVDTRSWGRVNAFCRNPRIAGKCFASLSIEELMALSRKMRSIASKGGLKAEIPAEMRPSQPQGRQPLVFFVPSK